MKKVLLGLLLGIFLSFSLQVCLAKEKKDYKQLYLKYKKMYRELGVEYEMVYGELIQCQRAINGDNPWDEMINK